MDFLRRNNGGDVTPLSGDSVPDVRGSVVEFTKWTPTERVALARVADAYGVSPAQAQKLGAVLMVFLASLES